MQGNRIWIFDVRTTSRRSDFGASGRVRAIQEPLRGRKFVCRGPNAIARGKGGTVKLTDFETKFGHFPERYVLAWIILTHLGCWFVTENFKVKVTIGLS
jgi:hypothetical protein